MADSLTLTIACDDYEIVQPLLDGRVKPEGVALVPQAGLTIAERQLHMLHDAAFDICELSATTYFLAREHGLPLAALPVFPLRRFRHGDIFVNTAAGIKSPADMAGKRVGGISYQVASNVWARGILAEHYGVPSASMTWVVERDEEVGFDRPDNLRIERLDGGITLEAALLSGQIDALMSPVVPPSIGAGDRRVARLFPDYREVEHSYFRKTGIFPIMHVLAVKPAVLDASPWLAGRLLKGFESAKALGYRRIGAGRAVPLAWFGSAWEEERRLLGSDPWAHGLGGSNTAALEILLRYMREQGMLRTAVSAESLFVDCR